MAGPPDVTRVDGRDEGESGEPSLPLDVLPSSCASRATMPTSFSAAGADLENIFGIGKAEGAGDA